MTRLRVMQLVSGVAIGEQSGGAESFAVRLAQMLDKDTFDLQVFAMWRYDSSSEREWKTKLENQGISVQGLVKPTSSQSIDLKNVFHELWHAVSEFKPEIINSHSERGDLFNSLLRVFHPTHPRVVRTVHIDQVWKTHPKLGFGLTQGVFPWMFSAEVTVSKTIQDMLNSRPLSKFLGKEAALYYNGIDSALFNENHKTKQGNETIPPPPGIPSVRPLIGVIGRLTDQKGHADLIQAMQIICRQEMAHLIVVGSGPLEEKLKKLSLDLGIQDFIYFLGSRKDVLNILPHLDLLVSSSLWEGFPTVLLEAMSVGVPIIATNVSGSRELVQPGSTGLLIDVNDPMQLACAISYVLENPEQAKRMASNAQLHVAKYTIQNTASCYTQLYQDIASSSKSS